MRPALLEGRGPEITNIQARTRIVTDKGLPQAPPGSERHSLGNMRAGKQPERILDITE